MASKLVIVESPAKAKTINKILGPDFIVKASMGHVRDLPDRTIGVDVKDGFKPKYVVIKRSEKIVRELQQAAKPGITVFLAPDPDREGEAIAWHLKALLAGKNATGDNFFRVTYNEITPRAIREAFSKPGKIDLNKVNSQQARRILDRMVGYMVSPLLWNNLGNRGLSAGRVQSVALRLVCEREEKIESFVPEAYWLMGARVRKQAEPRDPFEIRLARINNEKAEIKSAELAERLRGELENRALRVARIIRREIQKRAFPPFITSTLQQGASYMLGYSPARTMSIAQKLYEGIDFGEGAAGLITYMRTDSVQVSAEAGSACREFVRREFGPEYVPDKPNAYRSKASAQEAHEAIRPTDVNRTPESLAGRLSPEELKVYKLIWQRFVASQMTPARIAQSTVEIETPATNDKADVYLFRATASEIAFPGYMRAAGIEKIEKDENGEAVDKLPPLAEGEYLDLVEWLSVRKETQPPGRYSEASLIKALEEYGIGRPSTYAQTLATLDKRGYLVKEKKSLKPSPLGRDVNKYLVANLDRLFDVNFTATMEESLDKIEEGSVEWTAMLGDFYKQFSAWVEALKGPPADASRVRKIFELLSPIKEWAPGVQRGKRTYDDRKFADSVRKQLDEAVKPISVRQEQALIKLVLKYRDQVPDADARLRELGFDPSARDSAPADALVARKLNLLKAAPLESGGGDAKARDDKAFVESLDLQAQSGKSLSFKQLRALDRVLEKYAAAIPNFEDIRKELGLDSPAPAASAEDNRESALLLELIRAVKEWRPPVTRGKWIWDDHKFAESLARQYAQKHALSLKQLALLRKMVRKYKDQIPDYARAGLPDEPKKAPAAARASRKPAGH